jgi:hypothetical protein
MELKKRHFASQTYLYVRKVDDRPRPRPYNARISREHGPEGEAGRPAPGALRPRSKCRVG